MPLRFATALALLLLPGCPGPTAPSDTGAATEDVPTDLDAPGDDAGGETDAGETDGGEMDAGDMDAGAEPPDAPELPDAGEPDSQPDESSVMWRVVPEPMTIASGATVDFTYEYDVMLLGPTSEYTMTLRRCVNVAGASETCTMESRDPLLSPGSVSGTIDASGYAVGENGYRFVLVLERSGVLVDSDTIELVLFVS